ncbi:hypothetical protein ACET3Z_028688 [Daucus carota]
METTDSSAASNSETVGSLEAQAVKRKSDDVGWDYEFPAFCALLWSNITSEEIGEVTRRTVRELDEKDFESEDEANDNENLTFDFDDCDQQGW